MSSPAYSILQTIYDTDETHVHRAIRNVDHRAVILKMTGSGIKSQTTYEQMKHAYEIVKTLELPDIVKLLDLTTYQGFPTLVMEDFGGESLDHFIDGRMDVEKFLLLAERIAGSIAAIHQRGIMHKNLKPGNIIFNQKTDEVKIADFGIASLFPHERQSLQSLQHIEGSFPYMAPEQTGWMNRIIDSRSDLYALGITFYELLTGVLPFTAHDSLEWIHCHVARTPTPIRQIISDIPESINQIIMKLLAKFADDRYQTASGLRYDLEQCLLQWRSHKRIDPFPLGMRDISNHLQIPQKLYGREADIALLLQSFERVVATGAPELVLVSGYAGIGKTSLVHELYKPIMRERGAFVAGKFDQYKRDIPFATIVQSFTRMLSEILAGNSEQFALWRERIQAAVGCYGLFIVDMIPTVELIIGKQPPLPEMSAAEARSRFQMVLRQFIMTFAQDGHPLVLFLDDVQWADQASLDLLQDLITSAGVQHILVLGAYRDNEVTAYHPLTGTIQSGIKMGAQISHIVLNSLAFEHIEALIHDTLCGCHQDISQLAKLIEQKTDGNPFFVIQFLTNLYEEHMLYFNPEQETWEWEIDAIQQKQFTDNIAELVLMKLQRLAAPTQNALRQLALLGSRVKRPILAMIMEESGENEDLQEALQAGILFQVDDAYEFVHDRVQQAAYSLNPAESIPQLHLHVARILYRKLTVQQRDVHLFEITGHFNAGAALIFDEEEKLLVVELNLTAAIRAKAAAAYTSTVQFLQMAVSSLPVESWKRYYQLTRDVYLMDAECAYLTGDFATALRLCEIILDHVAGKLEKAATYLLKIRIHTTTAQFLDAIACGIEGLRTLGIDLPLDPLEAEIQAGDQHVWEMLNDRSIEDLIDLPAISDPDIKMAMEIMAVLSTPIRFYGGSLYYFIPAYMVHLSLRYGNAPASAYAYISFGMMLCHRHQRFDDAYRFGKLACDLAEKHNWSIYRVKSRFMMGFLVNPFKQPMVSSLDYLVSCFQSSLEIGEINNALYTSYGIPILLLMMGSPLEEIEQETEKSLTFMKNVGFGHFTYSLVSLQRFIRSLRGGTVRLDSFDSESFQEESFVTELRQRSSHDYCRYLIMKMAMHFLAGDYAAPLRFAHEIEERLPVIFGEPIVVEYYFYRALILTAIFPQSSADQREEYIHLLEQIQAQFKRLSDSCPENYLQYYTLIAAEMMRITEQVVDAEQFYEQAIQSAHTHGFVQHEAIAFELASSFYRMRGLTRIADTYIQESHACYLRWGADGKAKQLERRYPYLLEPRTASLSATQIVNTEDIDLHSAIKASQAISSEIVFETLIGTLLHALLEQSGAQNASLILVQDETFWIEAIARTSEQDIQTSMIHQVLGEASPVVPLSIIHYVKRTRERVLINHFAIDESPFVQDPYFIHNQPQSLVCFPLLRQNLLTGIVYLENTLTPYVFSSKRLSMLELLASQTAISLQNAQLYEEMKAWNLTLEQRVTERTHQLEEAHTSLQEAHAQLQSAHNTLAALAVTDPLTGLPNHRAMVQCLDKEIVWSYRYGRTFSVLFFDIDHFKALNDGIGHAAGDTALQAFGELVKTTLRQCDTLGRWGGEEFLAVLPETTDEIAQQIAERVRSTVASMIFPIGMGIHLTCSIGIACFPRDGVDRENLVHEADHAMYSAKRSGRNQVRVANEDTVKALEHKGEAQSRELTQIVGVVEALDELVWSHHHYVNERSLDASRLMLEVALRLGHNREEAQLIGLAGRIYDIGMVSISETILQKPEKLTEDEREIIRTHPIRGSEIISRVPQLQVFAPMIRSHHERWDGTGYPDGLVGKVIPIGARIAAVVDAYVAMTTDRPYRQALSQGMAIAELRKGIGTQFDPEIAVSFINILERQTEIKKAA